MRMTCCAMLVLLGGTTTEAWSLPAVVPPPDRPPTTEVPLWDGVAPGSEGLNIPEQVKDNSNEIRDRHVRNVTKPTLTVYLPEKEKNTGAAVVICPGGGYYLLAFDKEGHDVARWLASIGVAGCVLKYRLPRPDGHIYNHDIPLKDAQRAVQLVRHHAKKWNIKSNKVGMMGFSAGGHLTATASTHFHAGDSSSKDPVEHYSTRPDFSIFAYARITFDRSISRNGPSVQLLGKNPDPEIVKHYNNEALVTKETPPAFFIHTNDDRVEAENAVAYYVALRRVNVPAEIHIFAEGGHGYGIRKEIKGKKNLPVTTWPRLCALWMNRLGITKDHDGTK